MPDELVVKNQPVPEGLVLKDEPVVPVVWRVPDGLVEGAEKPVPVEWLASVVWVTPDGEGGVVVKLQGLWRLVVVTLV